MSVLEIGGQKMFKIKIIQTLYGQYSDYSDCEHLVRSITEWEDVSEEDYNYLTSRSGQEYLKSKGLCLLVMPPQEEIIPKTIREIKKAARKLEQEYAEANRKRQEAAEKVAEKKRLKAVEKAKKLLKEAGEL